MDNLESLIQAFIDAVQTGRIDVQIIINVPPVDPDEPDPFEVECKYCGKWKRSYTRKDNAVRALRGHLRRCSEAKKRKYEEVPQWLKDQMREEPTYNGKR